MCKYLVELYDDNYESRLIERFYLDSEEELQERFNNNIITMFNNGFIHKKVVLSVIEKEEKHSI